MEDLKGYIYGDRTGSQANQFITTTKAITSYGGCMWTNPQDIRIDIEKLEDATIIVLVKQVDIDEDVAKLLLIKFLDALVNRKKLYLRSKAILYSGVLGQCTDATKKLLEGEGIFDDIENESDVIKLLKLIKSISYAYESKSYPLLEVQQAMKVFYSLYQDNKTLCDFFVVNNKSAWCNCALQRNSGGPPFPG